MLLMDSVACAALGFGDRESGAAGEAMSGKLDSPTPPTTSPLTPTPPTTPAIMTQAEVEPPQGAPTAAAKAPIHSAASSSAACSQDSEVDSKPNSFTSIDLDQKPSKEQLLLAQNQTDKSALYPHLHSQLTQMQQRTQSRKKREDQQHKFHVDEMQSKPTASHHKNQRSSTTTDTPRSRSRRRARWKLKFHHQALPPEYLDHYEASLTRAAGSPCTAANDSSQPARIIGSRAPRTGDRKKATPSAALTPSKPPPPATPTPNHIMPQGPPHGIALEALAQFRALCARDEEAAAVMARLDAQVMDACKARVPELAPTEPSRFSNKALLTNLLNNRARQAEQDAMSSTMKIPHQTSPPKRPPGKVMTYQDLPYMGEMTLDNVKPRRGRKPKKADICHLIYKNYGTVLKGADDAQGSHPAQRKSPPGMSRISRPADKTAVQRKLMSSLLERRLTEDLLDRSEEPLNLCLRDLNQLKIRLLQKQSGSPPMEEKRPHPASSPYSMNIKSEPGSPSAEGVLVEVDADPTGLVGCHSDDGYIDDDISSYWTAPQQTPVFVHPLQLYNLGSFGTLQSHSLDPASTPSPVDGTLDAESLCARLGLNPGVSNSPRLQSESPPDMPHLTPFALPLAKRPQPAPSLPADSTDTGGGAAVHSGGRGAPGPWSSTSTTKRKRSAIFVPTVAADSPNATTEVSICKFKFTGGERPILQKKKMLSVDAGGNFRYYSGPSDERLFPPSQPSQPALRCPSTTPSPVTPPERPPNPNSPANRKKKSKKSLAREKLEKTFKEKGFLIQTQQLESAEGATYCKFRQLRKFTRYLFRSWKDYLPGSVRDMSMAAGVAAMGEDQQGLESLLPVLEEQRTTGTD